MSHKSLSSRLARFFTNSPLLLVRGLGRPSSFVSFSNLERHDHEGSISAHARGPLADGGGRRCGFGSKCERLDDDRGDPGRGGHHREDGRRVDHRVQVRPGGDQRAAGRHGPVRPGRCHAPQRRFPGHAGGHGSWRCQDGAVPDDSRRNLRRGDRWPFRSR